MPPGMVPPGMMPPGMAPPGMAPPGMPQNPGQYGAPPQGYGAPPNIPNINLNAPVIRLGPGTATTGGRSDSNPHRAGLGMERGHDQGRSANRGAPPQLIPPNEDQKLRTMMISEIPDGVGGNTGVERLLGAVGRLEDWDPLISVLEASKGMTFGFARFDDPESVSVAIKILVDEGVEVPTKKQPATENPQPEDDKFEGIEKEKLQVYVDATSRAYVAAYDEKKADEVQAALASAKAAVKQVIRDFFYPSSKGPDNDGDTAMGNAENIGNVEVVNIPLAQDDELSDIPAEMREVVAAEIAAFRERSTQRDLERLRREEEMEERERQRSGAANRARLDSPPGASGGVNNVPLGPRGKGVPNAPSGPRGQNGQRGPNFVSGGIPNTDYYVDDDDYDTDASDEEIYRRQVAKEKEASDKLFQEALRKWENRERSRAAALEREREREKQDAESVEARRQAAIAKFKAWDDEKEMARGSHPYYRDHAAWARKRAQDRQEEEMRDEADRRLEREEQQREQAQLEQARGMADSFLDRQADEMSRSTQSSAPAAPQPFKLSLGAAAQRNQASRSAPQRRTIVDVEFLLDDEEDKKSTKRQLIPIQFDASTAAASMTEEESQQAVRALAQEIPSTKDGLWNWDVKWEFMDEGLVKTKLRPFVEKKIVEYLGVQEEMLVEAVEEHLMKHGKAATLVEELQGVRVFPYPYILSHECMFTNLFDYRLWTTKLKTWSKNSGAW